MPALRRPPAVARVLERATATVREHEMVMPGQAVLASVSGGPDSVCLLESLVRLRRLLRISVEVFHFDHRLRSDSARDAAYVRRLAERHRLPFHLREAASTPARGESVEAWARRERMLAWRSVTQDSSIERVAEGHTLDDQAETLLMALVRGGGLDALAGIRPVLGPEVQPLIDTSREEVEAFCRALGLRPRRDPTNSDTRYLRNAVRLKGLPALERATGRNLRNTLARTANLLRIDQQELSRQAAAAADAILDEDRDEVLLDADELLSISLALRSRVVRLAIARATGSWTEDAIEAVLDLAAGSPGRRRDLPAGLKAWRDKEYVRVSRSSP